MLANLFKYQFLSSVKNSNIEKIKKEQKMASCLGLYVESNIIKYAKVSKEHEKIKVESFGVKFYENLEETINQIIEETYSYKTPISINLSEEIYNYFDMFSMLSNKDLTKAIKTEFDMYCGDQGYNPNVFETRYVISKNPEDKNKLKVIHIAENKIELNKKIQILEQNKLSSIVPVSMAITNLIETKPKENSLIINIEENTTVTTILDENVYDIQVFEEGSQDFLRKINIKENSMAKSYEICKNTTIYTSEGKELQETEFGYLEDIMPTLYTIVGNVKKIINESEEKITKVYLTGTATLINNLDLYFQEYLSDVECEILKPYFINQTSDISIQDYIEVNSAMAIALSGLGQGIQGINFKKQTFNEKVPDWLKIEVNSGKEKKSKIAKSGWLTNDLGEKLDKTEISLLRVAVGLIILLVIYSCFATLLKNQMEAKEKEAKASISNTNAQIQLAESDITKIEAKTNEYTEMIQNLEDLNDRLTDASQTRDAIPNLLNSIMYVIPENVQLTSIQNTTGTHIVIEAQSNKYEQLGMFKAKLDTEMILTNVISTSGQQENGVIKVTIEGDLP